MNTGVKPWGFSEGQVKPGDHIVMQPGNCDNAHLTGYSHSSLGGNLQLDYRNQFETKDYLTDRSGNQEGGAGGTELKLCYATLEAILSCPSPTTLVCHDKDDYATLDGAYQLLNWPNFTVGNMLASPTDAQLAEKRMVTGSKQRVNVVDGYSGDQVAWTQRHTCWYLEAPDGLPHIEGAQPNTTTCTPNYCHHGRQDIPSWWSGPDGNKLTPRPYTNVPDAIQTQIYDINDGSHVVTWHDYADPGEYRMCYKPRGGVFTLVPGDQDILVFGVRDMTLPGPRMYVIPKPIFNPAIGFAGVATTVSFASTNLTAIEYGYKSGFPTEIGYWNRTYGEYVHGQEGGFLISHVTPVPFTGRTFDHGVYNTLPYDMHAGIATTDDFAGMMEDTHCEFMSQAQETTHSFPPAQLVGLKMTTRKNMIRTTRLKICFATKESYGDGLGDYAELDVPWRQLHFWPLRTVQGATQRITFTGGVKGDQLVWTQGTSCEDSDILGPASTTKSVVYDIGDNDTWVDLVRPRDYSSGAKGVGDMAHVDETVIRHEFNYRNGRVYNLADPDLMYDQYMELSDPDYIYGWQIGIGQGGGAEGWIFDFHNTASVGIYLMCYKPYKATSFSAVRGRNFTIINRPNFASYGEADFGFAKFNFPLIFKNLYVGNQPGARPGDFVVIREHNCTDAHLTPNSQRSQIPQQLDEDLTIWTELHLDIASVLQVCFATYESHGDDAEDYAHLPLNWTQVGGDFSPRRTVHLAAQKILVTGGIPGDSVMWVRDPTSCPTEIGGLPRDNPVADGIRVGGISSDTGGFTEDKTPQYEFIHRPDMQPDALHDYPVDNVFQFPPGIGSGLWKECYYRNSRNTWHLHSLLHNFTMIPQPVFTPTIGIAGGWTKLTLDVIGEVTYNHPHSSQRLAGDQVVLVMHPHNCNWPANVQYTNNSIASHEPQVISPDPIAPDRDIIFVKDWMTVVGTYKLCFATLEAIVVGETREVGYHTGHGSDDYVEIYALNFTNYYPIDLSPKRTVLGSKKPITVTGPDLRAGDAIAFTQWNNCTKLTGFQYGFHDFRDTTGSSIRPWQTDEYLIEKDGSFELHLHEGIANGTFITCFLPGPRGNGNYSGAWTHLYASAMTIVSPPEYSPHVGMASGRTPLQFTGSFPRHKMIPFNFTRNATIPQYFGLEHIPDLMGDIVVIKEDNCTGAANTTWTQTSIGRTALGMNVDAYNYPIQDAMEIFLNMTIPVKMVVCFAVRETGGLKDEDFVMLTDWGLTPRTVIPDITFTTGRPDAISNFSVGPRNWVLGTTVLTAASQKFDQRHPPEFTPKRVFNRQHIYNQI